MQYFFEKAYFRVSDVTFPVTPFPFRRSKLGRWGCQQSADGEHGTARPAGTCYLLYHWSAVPRWRFRCGIWAVVYNVIRLNGTRLFEERGKGLFVDERTTKEELPGWALRKAMAAQSGRPLESVEEGELLGEVGHRILEWSLTFLDQVKARICILWIFFTGLDIRNMCWCIFHITSVIRTKSSDQRHGQLAMHVMQST